MFRWIEKRTMPPGTYWNAERQQYVEPGALGAVVTDTGLITWAKGVLVAWSKTDGSLPSLAMNYGLDPQDLTPAWTQRDGIELNLFTAWWNGSQKKPALPASPVVGTLTLAQLTDAHVTALTTWATQKGLAAAPQPNAPVPAPGAPSAAPSGWPSGFPWPPPQPPLWPSGVPWPPFGATPGTAPQGWPASVPWNPLQWLPQGWPTALPFPLPLPSWWQPSGPATPAPAPAEPQPQLPPAKKVEPVAPPPVTDAPAKSSISVPLIGVIIAGIGVLALAVRKGAPAQLMENPSAAELKSHGMKMLNWHSSGGDPIYAVGSFHYTGKLHPQRDVIDRAEHSLWSLLEETKPDPKGGSPVPLFSKNDRHELQNLIRGLHRFYPWLSAK